MRSLGTRRVAQAAGAAMVAVIALAGCSAGQVAETALLKAPVSGLNTQSPDGKLLIRNLQVAYDAPEGYPANGTAPLQVSLFNQTEQPMTVTISSRPQTDVTPSIVSAQQVGVGALAPSEEPSPSASAPAAEPPALEPAKFTIPPLGTQTFIPGPGKNLQAVGLSNDLKPGYSLSLTIQANDGEAIDVLAPFQTPTSPASRAPGNEDENSEAE
ncbi:hypothetical protein ACQPZX_47645 [Actinoplanes sp. CA-142083]|uniref:hypothetical protein n=1 Tax=Actinoplanes sp. CA-142083 TaxID=3239903 RepID=UPI003D92B150